MTGFEKIRNLFFGSTPQEPDPERRRLRSYIEKLTRRLEKNGWLILHHRDIAAEESVPDSPALNDALLQLRRHRQNNQDIDRNIDDLSAIGGFVLPTSTYNYFVMPNEKGLMARFAKTIKLDPDKLQAQGITDFDLYAQIFIHEASHVFGRDTTINPGNTLSRDEGLTYALHTARYLNHGGKPKAERLFNAITTSYNIVSALQNKHRDMHLGSAVATDWIRTRYNSALWNTSIDGTAADIPRAPNAEAISWARSGLNREMKNAGASFYLGTPQERSKLCTASFAAASVLTAQGHFAPNGQSVQLRAALPLRQLGRALRTLSAYDPEPS